MSEAIPVLPSLSIEETRAFYCDKLGFDGRSFEDEDYLIVRRGTVELHFWLTDDRRLCEMTSAYIRGEAIDAWHIEFRAKGIGTPMSVRPWGMEEFYVHDPHGNLLRFGRPRPG